MSGFHLPSTHHILTESGGSAFAEKRTFQMIVRCPSIIVTSSPGMEMLFECYHIIPSPPLMLWQPWTSMNGIPSPSTHSYFPEKGCSDQSRLVILVQYQYPSKLQGRRCGYICDAVVFFIYPQQGIDNTGPWWMGWYLHQRLFLKYYHNLRGIKTVGALWPPIIAPSMFWAHQRQSSSC